MFRTAVLKIILLAGVIVAADQIYRFTLYPKDLYAESTLYTYVQEGQHEADVLYFAESSNGTFSETDSLKNPISDFTSWHYPSLTFKAIEHGAYHAGIFKTLVRTIEEGSRVKVLVITMNLRSFGADWINSDLETHLQKTTVLYQPGLPILNRLLLSLNVFDRTPNAERRERVIHHWKTDTLRFPYPFPYATLDDWNIAMSLEGPAKGWDKAKTELSCHFIKNYAFQIDTLTNPRIKDFDEIAEMAKEKNIKIIFNLLAENVQDADLLVGKDLVFIMRQNRDLLVNYYAAKGIKVVDNLDAISSEYFLDKTWPSEHYSQPGRQAIAKNVAQALQEYFPGKYRDAW